jgi:hypothetical protein
MERQEPGRGERLRLLAKKYIVMPKGKAMEKDGRRSFSELRPTGANYGCANSATACLQTATRLGQ